MLGFGISPFKNLKSQQKQSHWSALIEHSLQVWDTNAPPSKNDDDRPEKKKSIILIDTETLYSDIRAYLYDQCSTHAYSARYHYDHVDKSISAMKFTIICANYHYTELNEQNIDHYSGFCYECKS